MPSGWKYGVRAAGTCCRDEGAGSAAEISISDVMSLEEMEAVANSMQSLIRWARAAKAAVEKERHGD